MSSASYKVKDVLPEQTTIVVLRKNLSIEETINLFAENRIKSAPVIDGENHALGLVDVVDLVMFMIQVATDTVKAREGDASATYSSNIKEDTFDHLLERSLAFTTTSVHEAALVNRSQRNPFVTLKADDEVAKAVEFMAMGVHRILLVEDDGVTIRHVLTQSRLNRFMLAHAEELLGARATQTLEGLGCVKDVVAVDCRMPAVDAFAKMQKHLLEDVAVVKDGKLLACLSASDIKLARDYRFGLLALSVEDWIIETRKDLGLQDPLELHCVYVKKDLALLDAMKLLAEKHVHRLFIADEEQKPIGVCSLTDVCKALK